MMMYNWQPKVPNPTYDKYNRAYQGVVYEKRSAIARASDGQCS